jgi:hypothetical protein
MLEGEYWGRLKAAGITPTRRVSETHWVGLTREREVVSIADPDWMTSEECEAACGALIDLYGSTCN